MRKENYDLVKSSLNKFGREVLFVSAQGKFQVAEHSNLGAGWFMRNTTSGEIVDCDTLSGLTATPSLRLNFARLVRLATQQE